MGLNGRDPEELTTRELQVATARTVMDVRQLLVSRNSSDGEFYMQLGALVRELSAVALSLGAIVPALQKIARGSFRPPPPNVPSPSTPAARDRLQSYIDVEKMSLKAASILDVEVNDGGEDTKTHKLRAMQSTASELYAMLEERRRKEANRIEARETWSFRFKVIGGIAAGIPIFGALFYVTIFIFKLLYVAAFAK